MSWDLARATPSDSPTPLSMSIGGKVDLQKKKKKYPPFFFLLCLYLTYLIYLSGMQRQSWHGTHQLLRAGCKHLRWRYGKSSQPRWGGSPFNAHPFKIIIIIVRTRIYGGSIVRLHRSDGIRVVLQDRTDNNSHLLGRGRMVDRRDRWKTGVPIHSLLLRRSTGLLCLVLTHFFPP